MPKFHKNFCVRQNPLEEQFIAPPEGFVERKGSKSLFFYTRDPKPTESSPIHKDCSDVGGVARPAAISLGDR